MCASVFWSFLRKLLQMTVWVHVAEQRLAPTPAPFLGHLLPTGGQEQAVPLPQRHWDKAQARGPPSRVEVDVEEKTHSIPFPTPQPPVMAHWEEAN